ncbi:hypothetical protein QOT17_001998 [Balamuthia mandrillaris]
MLTIPSLAHSAITIHSFDSITIGDCGPLLTFSKGFNYVLITIDIISQFTSLHTFHIKTYPLLIKEGAFSQIATINTHYISAY